MWLMSILAIGLAFVLVFISIASSMVSTVGAAGLERRLDRTLDGVAQLRTMWQKSAGKVVHEKRKSL